MLVRNLLLGGAAALGASAMLVIPEMEPKMEAVEDGFVNINPMLIEDTHHSVVDLPCNDCPFRQFDKEGAYTWTEGKPSSLVSHSANCQETCKTNADETSCWPSQSMKTVFWPTITRSSLPPLRVPSTLSNDSTASLMVPSPLATLWK